MTARPPATPLPPANAFRTDIQVRFADTDALGHVNNGSYVIYSETARLAFARSLFGAASRALILANVSVDFRRQVLYDEAVSVFTWVKSVGRTSVTLQQSVHANGELAAEIGSVVVSFDYAAQQSMPWSDEARAAMQPFLVDERSAP